MKTERIISDSDRTQLAGQMNVSRQSVSKWEGAQSIPDLEKMIRLSKLFGVTTDYLLKDEIEEIGNPETVITDEEETSRKHVSMEEANSFLSVKEETSKRLPSSLFYVFFHRYVFLSWEPSVKIPE